MSDVQVSLADIERAAETVSHLALLTPLEGALSIQKIRFRVRTSLACYGALEVMRCTTPLARSIVQRLL